MKRPAYWFWLPALLLMAGCASEQQQHQQWRHLIGSKLMLDIRHFCSKPAQASCENEDVTELPAELSEFIRRYQIGGVILFADNLKTAAQTKQLTDQIQASSGTDLPLLIGIDQEGGAVNRLPAQEFVPFAGNMALGATYPEVGTELAQQVASLQARQLKALGVNLNFAPSLDLNSNPNNPVINIRSFGDNPEQAAELGLAMVKTLQHQGVLATIKHFPGHGDTHVDSHTGLPLVEHPLQQVQQIDMAPFRQVIAQGQPAAVMTAHIQYPALDSSTITGLDGKPLIRPATLSRTILTDVLRKQLGFEGIIITDALNMAGIAHFFSPSRAVIETFAAGADIALMPAEIRKPEDLQQLELLIDDVVAAIKNGELALSELEHSAERLKKVRQQLPQPGTVESAAQLWPQSIELEQQLAETSLTALDPLPDNLLQQGQKLHLFMPDASKCQSFDHAFEKTSLQLQLSCTALNTLNPDAAIPAAAKAADWIIGAFVWPGQSAAELGVLADLTGLDTKTQPALPQRDWLKQSLQQLTAAGKQTLMLSMRTPYELTDFATAARYRLASYHYYQRSADQKLHGPAYDAVARLLSGQIKAKGVLPVRLTAEPSPAPQASR